MTRHPIPNRERKASTPAKRAPASGVITIECRTCHGSGEEMLPEEYRRLYELIGFDWSKTSDVLAKMSGVKNTALLNRLAHLESLGLVSSRVSPDSFRAKEWKRL